MFKNYLISAFRNAGKKKIHTFLNLIGLSLGMAGALLTAQYVAFESSYNDFHEKRDNICRISYSKEKGGKESFNTVLTYSGVGRLMKEQFPEVLDFVRLSPARKITSTALIKYQDNVFEESDVYFTDPSFFDIFSFELVSGDPKTALNEQYAAVISETMAKKYFGNDDPIGKSIRRDGDQNYVITGVLKDTPANSHVKINILFSHNTLAAFAPAWWTEDNLSAFHGHLYLLLKEGTDIEALQSKFPKFVDDFVHGIELAEHGITLKFGLFMLTDIHLDSHIQHEAEINGDREIVEYMSIIGTLILIIAMVNYINLSTARAMERAKEIGVRKVNGAKKIHLIAQHMMESLLVNWVSIMIAVIMVYLSQPLLADLGADKLLTISLFTKIWFWLMAISMWLFSSLAAGIYPALILSSYHPVTVLKGKLTTNRSSAMLRKTLVIFQFTCSLCLIIGTLIIYDQITFMRSQKLGMSIDDKLIIKGPMLTDSTYLSKAEAFRNLVLQQAHVSGMTASRSIPGKEYNSATWFNLVENPEADAKFCYINGVTHDFVDNYKMEIVAGRDFDQNDSAVIIINEAMVDLFELESPEAAIGKHLTTGDPSDPESRKYTIVGVLKDFNQQSLKNDFSPVIIFVDDEAAKFYSISIKGENMLMQNVNSMISEIEFAWRTYFPSSPFNYYFLQDGFDAQYKTEIEFGRLLLVFSILAIAVGILGLIGLSTFSIQQRTKEIGIRKVLGSDVRNISFLLGKDVLWLIIIANVIAWPICWVLLEDWLAGFAFRTTLTIIPFILSFICILIISALSIAYQVIRASLANPIEALKNE